MKAIIVTTVCIFTFPSVAMACSTARIQHLENENVKVWTSRICPNDELTVHTHQHPRVIIPDSDGKLEIVYENGRKLNLIMNKNVPLYLDAKQGIEPHRDFNKGDHPINIKVVEIKSAT